MKIVVAGVSGCGKSTIGRMLAERMDCEFLDADDFHPPENIAKMRSGVPLDDNDRVGWLEILGRELAVRDRVVLACSALKRAYRDRLAAAAGDLRFVLLILSPAELKRRMEERGGHFMPPSLLESQLAILEKSGDLIEVANSGSPDVVVEGILTRLA